MGAHDLSNPLQLEAAFADFEAASSKLAEFYQTLEGQVAKLTAELHSARAAELQQLREKEILAGRLANLLATLPAGVVVLDGAGRIAEFNPAASALLGSIESGQRWVDIVNRVFEPQWDDGHDISLSDGRRVNIATEPLTDEPGQILLIKDVTETRRLQELLNHHRRLSAKTELAAALAHQIRTPLAAAMLHTSNLGMHVAGNERAARTAGRALDAMRQLERLVEDMLTYARGGKLDAEAFNLGALIERLLANVKTNTPASEFRCLMVSEVPDLTLVGNTDALVSMMLNMINNARNATNGSGQVAIDVTVTDSLVQIGIEDNGPGIADHAAEHVFEPFFTTTSSGTGLGLAVARSIARAHGGDLQFEQTVTPGARFVLSLPLPATTNAADGAESHAEPTAVNAI